MSAPSVSPPRPGPPTDGLPLPRRYWAIAAILLAIAMSVLDSTIVNIALPSIARDFGATAAASIWVVNAYQLAILLVLLPDRKSTRLNSSHSQISYAVFCLKKIT